VNGLRVSERSNVILTKERWHTKDHGCARPYNLQNASIIAQVLQYLRADYHVLGAIESPGVSNVGDFERLW
jgi:hypothetical protein